jgi:predicted dehydrogenase
MSAALKRAGKTRGATALPWCQIGFQSQSAPAVRSLKRAICDGRLGRIREVIVRCFWMRDNHYYARNAWAGKLTDTGRALPRASRRYTLDGCINNPQAHYLFNGLFWASMEWGQAALPKTVRAELYHAHEIESEDTACLEIICQNGAKVYFYGTLAAAANQPIVIEVTGEKGRATWDAEQRVKYYEGDKLVEEVPPPAVEGRFELWRNAIRCFRGQEDELYCPLDMTRAHVLAVNGAFLSMGRTKQIPAAELDISEQTQPKPHRQTIIKGIEDIVAQASAGRKLYSDLGVPWAVKTKATDVSRLTEFQLPS